MLAVICILYCIFLTISSTENYSIIFVTFFFVRQLSVEIHIINKYEYIICISRVHNNSLLNKH